MVKVPVAPGDVAKKPGEGVTAKSGITATPFKAML